MRWGIAGWILALLIVAPAPALEWISLIPNSAYSRDIALGSSTIAQYYAPQSQSSNPAGLVCFPKSTRQEFSLFVNPAGMWQVTKYFGGEDESPHGTQQAIDVARLMTGGVAFGYRVLTVATFLSQPVMMSGDDLRYRNFESKTPLSFHQNSAFVKLALHPRVSLGGRIDRYYHGAVPEREGYSYGAILRPRGINVGIGYQRFPSSSPRVWNPLDHRTDAATNAGVSAPIRNVTLSFQIVNLTDSRKQVFLEPHAGIEWRPVRALALRTGGVSFSRSRKYAWTTGFGLIDANWLRSKSTRLSVPDDILQFALAIIYDDGRPVTGFGSLTVAWRF